MLSWKRKKDASINRGEGVRIGVMRALNRQSELEVKHSKELRVTRVRMIPVFQTGALTAGTCVARSGWDFRAQCNKTTPPSEHIPLERRCALAFDPSVDKQRRCARVVMKTLPPPARILTAGYGLCRGAEQLMWSAGAA